MKRVLINRKTGEVFKDTTVKKKNKWIALSALIITGVLSSLSDFHTEKILGIEYNVYFDMFQHGGYYFLLTLFLIYLLPQERQSTVFFLFIFFFSFLFEALQLIIPNRTFSQRDIISNLLGISAGFIVYNIYFNFFKKKTTNRFRVRPH